MTNLLSSLSFIFPSSRYFLLLFFTWCLHNKISFPQISSRFPSDLFNALPSQGSSSEKWKEAKVLVETLSQRPHVFKWGLHFPFSGRRISTCINPLHQVKGWLLPWTWHRQSARQCALAEYATLGAALQSLNAYTAISQCMIYITICSEFKNFNQDR